MVRVGVYAALTGSLLRRCVVNLRVAVVAGLLVVLGGGCALAQAVESPASQHAVLVELFTSEGCSDCPPADAVLQKMNGNRTAAGTVIIGLSEHVTYWNHDGWVDPFSDEVYTERQKVYGDRFQLADVYTPMAVVMGEKVVNGSDGYHIVQAVDAAKSTAVTMHIASVNVVGKKAEVVFSVEGVLPKKGAEIYAVMTDDLDTDHVASGENGGRTLTHVAVARSLEKVATVKDGAVHTVQVKMPSSAGAHHVVLIAQEEGVGKVLAVETKGI
jgi:hypothetical protein